MAEEAEAKEAEVVAVVGGTTNKSTAVAAGTSDHTQTPTSSLTTGAATVAAAWVRSSARTPPSHGRAYSAYALYSCGQRKSLK